MRKDCLYYGLWSKCYGKSWKNITCKSKAIFPNGVQLAVIEVVYQKQDMEKQIDLQFDEDKKSEEEHNFSENNS